MLKLGLIYKGYYVEPFEEVTAIYRGMRENRLVEPPGTLPTTGPVTSALAASRPSFAP
jgi:hypothetical protein